MKPHIPLFIALVTIAFTVLVATEFISRTRRVVALQADPTIRLPVSPREKPANDSSHAATIILKPGGTAYFGGMELSDASLGQLLSADAGKQVILQTTAGVNYQETKAFLHRLEAFGVTKIVLKTSNQ